MRPRTTIAIVAVLAVILVAALVQFFIIL